VPRALRLLAWVGGSLIAVAIVAGIVVYAISEQRLRRTYDVPLRALSISTDSASVAEGERLARIRGCSGCHGAGLEGKPFFNEPGVANIWAPNLTQVVREYTDPELERVIRHGVMRNGRSVFVMPSAMFAELADDDLVRIIAFLRSQPLVEGPRGEFQVGPLGRIGLVTGEFKPVAAEIDAAPAEHVPREPEAEWGRYLARTTCSECHGSDLHGDPSGKPPDLRIAAAYSEADWVRLMREGRGVGNRGLGLMSTVARGRFSYLTDAEVHAIRAYLQAMDSLEPRRD